MFLLKSILLFISALFFYANANAQNELSKFQITSSYNQTLNTNYRKESGQINLVGRKGVSVVSMQASWQFKEQKKWIARFGTEARLFIQNEVLSGLSGNFPDSFTTNNGYTIPLYRHRREARGGANEIERIGLSFQLSVGRKLLNKNKSTLALLTTISPTFYFGAFSEEIAQLSWAKQNNQDAKLYYVFRTSREFTTNKIVNINNALKFTRPILEFQFALEGSYLLKKGALVYGIKANINAEKFEEAKYTILPEFPAYTSTGSYTLNRSYVGIYAGYRFKKKK
jgi:hypothetical protein